MPCHAPAAAGGLRCRTRRALSASRTTSCAQRSDGGGGEGTTRSDSQPYSLLRRRRLPCPHTDTPVAAARRGAGASPARGTCPLRDPAQDAAATRNRNSGEDQSLQEAGASHAGSGKFLFRHFPLPDRDTDAVESLPDPLPGQLPPAALPLRLRGASSAPGAAPVARAPGPGGRRSANQCAASCGGRGPMGGRVAEVRGWRWLEVAAEEESGVRGRWGWRRGLGRRRERESPTLCGLPVAVCRCRRCGQGRKRRRVCACGGANRSQRSRSLSCPCCCARCPLSRSRSLSARTGVPSLRLCKLWPPALPAGSGGGARAVPARCPPSGRASAGEEAGAEIGAASEPGWRQEPSFGFQWVCLKRTLVFVSVGEVGRHPGILEVHRKVGESEEFS